MPHRKVRGPTCLPYGRRTEPTAAAGRWELNRTSVHRRFQAPVHSLCSTKSGDDVLALTAKELFGVTGFPPCMGRLAPEIALPELGVLLPP